MPMALNERAQAFEKQAKDSENATLYWLGKRERTEEIASDMRYVLKQRLSNDQ